MTTDESDRNSVTCAFWKARDKIWISLRVVDRDKPHQLACLGADLPIESFGITPGGRSGPLTQQGRFGCQC